MGFNEMEVTGVKDVTEERMKYPTNPLNAINEGCLVDVRVKMATDFLKAGETIQAESAAEAARMALDLADEVMRQADERGWVQPLDNDTSEMPKSVKRHVEVNVRMQLHANEKATKWSREGIPMVMGATIPHGGFPQ